MISFLAFSSLGPSFFWGFSDFNEEEGGNRKESKSKWDWG